MELLFHSIILAHCLLYLTKILFELSLSISRITNFLEVGNLGCMFVIVVTKYVEIFLKANQDVDMSNSDRFYDFQMFVSIEEIIGYSLTFCSFFFPFRVFQWLAHFKFFHPAKTVINTLCRTTPGVTVYVILAMIMVISWAQGIYISLSPLYPEFETF
jgi:hypothetical protein